MNDATLTQPRPPTSDAHRHRKATKDILTLARFIELYCRDHHADAGRRTPMLRFFDVEAQLGKDFALCEECNKLLAHAIVKRQHCPMDPKPQCKHCPNHCYAPRYRKMIRHVMRYSGRKILMRGRLDYLFHLLF